jgi:hypothetical protein
MGIANHSQPARLVALSIIVSTRSRDGRHDRRMHCSTSTVREVAILIGLFGQSTGYPILYASQSHSRAAWKQLVPCGW